MTKHPQIAPIIYDKIKLMVFFEFYLASRDPSLIATAKVTAGLKCDPQTGERNKIEEKRQKATANAILPPTAPQLTEMSNKAVPTPSKKQIYDR